MSAFPSLEYSLSQVKRAGKILRAADSSVLAATEDEVRQAVRVAQNWRRAHSEAENWAQMGCRQRLRSLGIDGRVTQRLKELATIRRKLVREGHRVQLSTMEDIAGARAVVPDLAALRRLEARWLQNPSYPIEAHRDRIVDPPPSGYRAVHFVMRHKDRRVEIQLRTRLQNEWGMLVEELGEASGFALKNGEGPPSVLEYLAGISDGLASLDERPTRYAHRRSEVLDALTQARAEARRLKEGGR
ncbi:RelA/SpoT domain-containing protein [Nitriliruptoraceae bacterium ZYF776]|nr:RelA/SpoT domain-containing protein [Profundirhabdus halotolerans]